MGAPFRIGPFDLELIRLTHSIPEANGVAIRTGAGTVMHTGDWKFDPGPVVGEASDVEALKRVSGEDVLALVGDFDQRVRRRLVRFGSRASRTP